MIIESGKSPYATQDLSVKLHGFSDTHLEMDKKDCQLICHIKHNKRYQI